MPSAQRELVDELAVREALDTLESQGETIETLVERVDQSVYRDAIPNCDNDPSFLIPKPTGYSVDQGVKLPKVGNDDACTTGHNNDHCWTEYWFVESAIEYTNWENSGAAIDCKSTSSCNSFVAQANQTCTTYNNDTWVAWSLGLDATLDLAVLSSDPNVHLGVSPGYSHTSVEGKGTSRCTTFSTTKYATMLSHFKSPSLHSHYSTCIWSDQACHQVWYADRVKRIWGHASRVCVGTTKAGKRLLFLSQRTNVANSMTAVQQQTKNAAGFYVRGQVEFSIAIPVNQIVGCNSLCGTQEYTAPLPTDADQRVPFEIQFLNA